jgi:hypothetical protein
VRSGQIGSLVEGCARGREQALFEVVNFEPYPSSAIIFAELIGKGCLVEMVARKRIG